CDAGLISFSRGPARRRLCRRCPCPPGLRSAVPAQYASRHPWRSCGSSSIGNNQLRLLYVRRVVRLVVTGIVIREGGLASVSVLEERRPGKRVVVQVRVAGQVSVDVVLVLRDGELTVIEIVCEL